jgi:hypothetical protein
LTGFVQEAFLFPHGKAPYKRKCVSALFKIMIQESAIPEVLQYIESLESLYACVVRQCEGFELDEQFWYLVLLQTEHL